MVRIFLEQTFLIEVWDRGAGHVSQRKLMGKQDFFFICIKINYLDTEDYKQLIMNQIKTG